MDKKINLAPILFIIYNRADSTEKVFNEIRKARPNQLFIAADGPKDNSEDRNNCFKTRNIISMIDWDCKVKTQLQEHNLGCKLHVNNAISWFFGCIDEGIILEDDCLPSQSFFIFCSELLQQYRKNDRVMMIGGVNFHPDNFKINHSYYFSYLNHIWGWATWKRAWDHYDITMSEWKNLKKTKWIKNFTHSRIYEFAYREAFYKTHSGVLDTWDYQWLFSCWIHEGLSILPSTNLVSNIGFSKTALHTQNIKNPLAAIPANDIDFPLNHPLEQKRNIKAELSHYAKLFPRKITLLIKSIFFPNPEKKYLLVEIIRRFRS